MSTTSTCRFPGGIGVGAAVGDGTGLRVFFGVGFGVGEVEAKTIAGIDTVASAMRVFRKQFIVEVLSAASPDRLFNIYRD
jgi:hypothetical protein